MRSTAPAIDVSDLVQDLGLLIRRYRAEGSTQDLAWTESIVLRRLGKEGSASAAALAREIGVKPQSMSATVAGLKKKGLVESRPHPSDGRQRIILLTTQGENERRRASDARRAWLSAALAKLDQREQNLLLEAGPILRRLAQS